MMTNGIGKKSVGKDFAMAISGRARDYITASDYYESEIHSPTDSSEDSVEVKISPILARNKRKCAEPRKVQETTLTGPLKKRMCLEIEAEKNVHPFRPWSPKTTSSSTTCMPSSKRSSSVEAYFRPPTPIKIETVDEEQPIALIKKREETPDAPAQIGPSIPRVPVHPEASSMTQSETEIIIRNSTEHFPSLAEHHSPVSKREQRNYKNMTRERRIEANARERTRVHTISAAFDTLRKSVPSYSHNQKLSKLSVLRIACSYIMTLSSIVNEDDGGSESSTTASCVDLVTKTIQREGKLRKKKDDDND